MKIKNLLLAALCAATVLPTAAFVSCGDAETNEPVGPVGTVCLSDFETYKPDFQLIRILNHFGAINVNTDPQYVKSGKASAKIQVGTCLRRVRLCIILCVRNCSNLTIGIFLGFVK